MFLFQNSQIAEAAIYQANCSRTVVITRAMLGPAHLEVCLLSGGGATAHRKVERGLLQISSSSCRLPPPHRSTIRSPIALSSIGSAAGPGSGAGAASAVASHGGEGQHPHQQLRPHRHHRRRGNTPRRPAQSSLLRYPHRRRRRPHRNIVIGGSVSWIQRGAGLLGFLSAAICPSSFPDI
jgi:hypothetical protein